MEKIFEDEVEEILKAGEKKYLTITYKKLSNRVIMRINTISKDYDLCAR